MIIAVDGPAASGKGTLARRLSAHFDLAFLDTGALYRAVAFAMLQTDADISDEAAATSHARALDLRLADAPAIRTATVGAAASRIAAMKPVRQALLDLQRQFAANPPGGRRGAVLDGRDIGTVICPEATHKLFVTADPEIRAARRFRELLERGETTTFGRVLEDLQARDVRDASRCDAPMRPADDAFVLDTTALDPDQAFEQALAFVISGTP